MKKKIFIFLFLSITSFNIFSETRNDIETFIQKETVLSVLPERFNNFDFSNKIIHFGYEWRFGLLNYQNLGYYTDIIIHNLIDPNSISAVFFCGGVGLNYKNGSSNQLNGLFITFFPAYDLCIYKTKNNLTPYYNWSTAIDYGYSFSELIFPINLFIRNIICLKNKEIDSFISFGFSIGLYF